MRALVLAVALAGCVQSLAPTPAPASEAMGVEPFHASFFDETMKWILEDPSDPLDTALDVVWIPLQTVGAFCVAPGYIFPYNLHLLRGRSLVPVPNGTSHVEIDLAWTSNDYLGQDLHLAWSVHGTTWHVSQAIPNGEVTQVPLEPGRGRAALRDEPGADMRLDLWLCYADEGTDYITDPGWELHVFAGSVDVQMAFVGERPLDPAASDGT